MLCFYDLLQDDGVHKDEYGVEVASGEDAREEATALAMALAHEHHFHSDEHTIVVEARSEERGPFYRIMMRFDGAWLVPDQMNACEDGRKVDPTFFPLPAPGEERRAID